MSEMNEQEQLKGFRENDPEVLERFYALQYPSVRSFVKQNSGRESDAQDVFQEAMTAAWLNIKEGRFSETAGSNLGAYVYRIAKNKWLDRLRSAQFKQVNNAMEEVSDRIAEVTEDERVSERIEYLQQLYAKLDDKCRTILDMFYYDKKNLESIAHELGYDVGSIRTMKYRCMMKLRKQHLVSKNQQTL